MKTLIVSGNEPVPDEIRQIVRQGSTSVDEVSDKDLVTYVSREGLGVDRIVFWTGYGDEDVRTLAWNYATAAGTSGATRIIVVTATPAEAPIDGMATGDFVVWPRDEDKLRLLLTTAG